MSSDRHIRVLIAKPGLDGHDRGAKVVARGLRDAGMEVVYTGLHRTPEQIVRAAVDEDVDVVGLSVLSGAHDRLVPEVVAGLTREGRGDALVLVGGIIPEADAAELLGAGVAMVFGPGTTMEHIAAFIRSRVGERS